MYELYLNAVYIHESIYLLIDFTNIYVATKMIQIGGFQDE